MESILLCPRCFSERGEAIYYASCQNHCAVCKNPRLLPVSAIGPAPEPPTVDCILADLSASGWLKSAILAALSRDPVDAANDADVLAAVLDGRARDVLAQTETLSEGGKA